MKKKVFQRFICILLSLIMVIGGNGLEIRSFARDNDKSDGDQVVLSTSTDASETTTETVTNDESGNDVVSSDNAISNDESTEAAIESNSDFDNEVIDGEDDEDLEESSSIENSDDDILSWDEWLKIYHDDYKELSKEDKIKVRDEYRAYLSDKNSEDSVERERSAYSDYIKNNILKIFVDEEGHFSIGNIEGNPNYSTDDGQKLLYGFPTKSTSNTLIKVNDDEYFFDANSISYSKDSVTAVMNISKYNVSVIQKLVFFKTGNVNYTDSVRISYSVINRGAARVKVGVRIMIDTMLADNDDAPFKITGHGNVTDITTFSGSNIPSSYQVYDDLTAPTTIATGFLTRKGERKPDTVMFTHWPDIEDASWDYVPDEGGNLGDSAVGIYFNPVELYSGQNTEVSTYYGVGVGGSIVNADTNIINLRSDESAIVVKETGTSKCLENVDVKLSCSGKTLVGSTDSKGQVVLTPVPSGATPAVITLEKEGYKTRTVTVMIKGGSVTSVSMKNNNDTTPMIDSVTLNGKDILNDTVHYVEDHNNILANTSKTRIKKVTIKAKADTDDCVYYLMQDQSVIDFNETGEFELDSTVSNSENLIATFKSGTRKYIQCVSKDGKKSDKALLGIKVSIPTTQSSSIGNLDLWPYGKANIATGTLGALLLGDSAKFGIGKKFDLKFEIKEDGKIQVGLNLKALPESNADAKTLFKAFSKQRFDKALKSKFQDKQASVSIGPAKLHPSIDVMGYGEGIVKDGKVNVDLCVSVSAKVSAEYTQNFFYIVPLYITLRGEAELKAEVKVNVANEKGWNFGFTSGTLTPSVSITIGGGVGTKGVASIGVEGTGKIEVNVNFVSQQTKATLSGDASIVLGFWVFEKKLKLAEGKMKIYDSNDKEGTVYGEDSVNISEAFAKQDFELKDLSYLNNVSKEGISSDGFAMNEITEANPIIVSANGKKYKFWISGNNDRSQVSNKFMLVYSVCEDGSWGPAIPVEDDGTGDYTPSVYAYGNKIYVAWQDSSEMFDDETVTVDDMARSADIKYTYINTSTDKVSNIVKVTNDTNMNVIPAIVSNGNVYIAWYSTSADIFTSEEIPEGFLKYKCVSSMSSPISVSLGQKDVSKISVADVSGDAYAYVTASDEEVTIENMNEVTSKIYSYNMSESAIDSSSAVEGGSFVTGTLNGTRTTFWYQDGNIYYSVNEGTAKKVFSDDSNIEGVKSGFSLADGGDKTYILWSGASDVEGKKAIFATVYDGTNWSSPYIAEYVDSDSVSSLSASVEGDKVTLSYMTSEYDDDGNIIESKMNEVELTERVDISLENISYKDADVGPGEKLPMILTLHNNGNTDVESVNIEVPYADYYETKTIHISPNSSVDYEVDDLYLPDYLEGKENIKVTAYGKDDVDMDNGSSDITIGYALVNLEQEGSVFFDDDEYYRFKLINSGKIDAENVQVKIIADEKNGTIIYDKIYEELNAGQSEYIYVNADNFKNCSKAYSFLYADTELDNEGNEYQLLSVNEETILLTDSVSITVGNEGNGEIYLVEDNNESVMESGEYSAYETMQIKAVPESGYLFSGWETVEGYIKDDTEAVTQYVTPSDGNDTLKAVFVEESSCNNITISESSLNLQKGSKEQLNAVTDPVELSNRVVWKSSDPSVATVDKHGKVTAVSGGTAYITATSKDNEDVYDSCEVEVENVPIESIRMVYPEYELDGVGATDSLDIIVKPEVAEDDVLWSSSNPSVVEVDEDGNITAKSIGQAVITAYDATGNISAQSTVRVNSPLKSISLNKSVLTVNRDETGTVKVVYNPTDTTDDKTVTWVNYSDDLISMSISGDHDEIASFEGLEGGTALVAAYVGDMVTYLTVIVEVPITDIDLENSHTLSEGESYGLDYDIYPYDYTEMVSWKSSNENVVTVSDGGYIYAHNPGTAVITLSSASGISRSCSVTVTEKKYDIVNVTGPFGSDHPYKRNTDKVWQIVRENAGSISFSFSSSCELEEDCDYLYIMDSSNKVLFTYTGKELAGKTVSVPGSVVRFRLTSDGSVQKYGFAVTSIRAAYSFDPHIISVSEIPNQTYTGAAITPAVAVSAGGVPLTNGVDYTVSYLNNVNIGIATVVINALAPSTGSVSVNFAITLPQLTQVNNIRQIETKTKSLKLTWDIQPGATGYNVYKYNKKKKNYVLFKKLDGGSNNVIEIKKLKAKTKYKFAVEAICESGSDKAAGPKTAITVATASKATSIKSISSSNKSITVNWKKITGVSGYEIALSTKKKSGYKVKASAKKNAKSVKIKGLKKGKTYYVKVRTYINTSSGKVYSDFSKIKTIKVK